MLNANKYRLFSIYLIVITINLFYSCDGSKDVNGSLPTLSTIESSKITYNTANSGGVITSNGGSEIVECGVCWSVSTAPTITNNKTKNDISSNSFTSSLAGLVQNTSYFVRAYATNSFGTGYGNEIIIKTPSGDQATKPIDIDGNVYPTVTIGTQVWMADNLKVTHFRDGIAIPNISDNTAWSSAGYAYCNYENNENISLIHGKLYNRSAVLSPNNLAPIGWHIPSDQEMFVLQQFLGGQNVAGGKLKDNGLVNWQSPNTAATNISGFSALPSGYRSKDGAFGGLGSYCYLWSYGGWAGINIWTLKHSTASFIVSGGNENSGYSVRCIRD